jgi:hypothetical protein
VSFLKDLRHAHGSAALDEAEQRQLSIAEESRYIAPAFNSVEGCKPVTQVSASGPFVVFRNRQQSD